MFCNPPYGRELPKWIKKAHDEAEKGALVVMLIPARTDTRAFHDYIYHLERADQVWQRESVRAFSVDGGYF